MGARADQLVAVGATRGEEHNEPGGRWIVMQDPEGNEFCLH
jgi:predicted enzyme related to lactoylglutathione lyase